MKSISAIFLFAGLVAIASVGNSYGEESRHAPFGLSWGLSAHDVKTLGVSLKPVGTSDKGKTFSATGLPKMISDVEVVLLAFGNDDKLWHITAVSKTFSNDPYGTAVRARYDALSKALTSKYGNPNVNHHTDTDLWTKPSEFLMGIKTGRSWHYTNCSDATTSAQISIRASSNADAYYVLIFRNKTLAKTFEKSQESREKDAL